MEISKFPVQVCSCGRITARTMDNNVVPVHPLTVIRKPKIINGNCRNKKKKKNVGWHYLADVTIDMVVFVHRHNADRFFTALWVQRHLRVNSCWMTTKAHNSRLPTLAGVIIWSQAAHRGANILHRRKSKKIVSNLLITKYHSLSHSLA